MRPTAIGIGAQKCASSWAHSVLNAHPDVGVSDPKEVDFFSYHFDHGYQWYERHFNCLDGYSVRCETSPSYLYDPRAPERALAYDKNLKVVAILRDPIARAYSNHLHEVIKGHIEPQSFETGMLNNPAYIEQGQYHRHLKRWIDTFGPKQVLVLIAEDIGKDPERCAACLYDFIGVDSGFSSAVARERRNVSDLARSRTLRHVLRSGGNLLRRAGLEEQLVQLKSTGAVAGMLNANSVDIRKQIPPMLESTRQHLTEFFAPDLSDLPELLGRTSLPWPTWRAATAGQTRTPIAV
ncbi:MAG: sulfotransferase domain-containing protein [Pseudomonadota bacterium]